MFTLNMGIRKLPSPKFEKFAGKNTFKGSSILAWPDTWSLGESKLLTRLFSLLIDGGFRTDLINSKLFNFRIFRESIKMRGCPHFLPRKLGTWSYLGIGHILQWIKLISITMNLKKLNNWDTLSWDQLSPWRLFFCKKQEFLVRKRYNFRCKDMVFTHV